MDTRRADWGAVQLDIEPHHVRPVEVVKPPVWMLIRGDCMEVMKDSTVFDLVMTDIPYGEANQRRSHAKSIRKIKKVEGTDAMTFLLPDFVDACCEHARGHVFMYCGYEQLSDIVRRMRHHGMHARVGRWRKTNPSPMNGHTRYLSDIELCAVGAHKGAEWFGRSERPEWDYRTPTRKEKMRHDAIKPVGLWAKMLGPVARPGMSVFDPCAGSCTSGEAAIDAGLDWVGVELDEEVATKGRPYLELAAAQLHIT